MPFLSLPLLTCLPSFFSLSIRVFSSFLLFPAVCLPSRSSSAGPLVFFLLLSLFLLLLRRSAFCGCFSSHGTAPSFLCGESETRRTAASRSHSVVFFFPFPPPQHLLSSLVTAPSRSPSLDKKMRADATEFFPSSTLRADGRLLLPASASPSPPPPPPPPCSSPSPCSAAPPPHAAASFSSSSSSYSPSTAREPRLRSSPQHSRSSPSSSRLVGSLSSPPSEDPYKEGLRRHNHKPYTSHRANQGHRSVVDAPSEDNAPPRSTRGTSSSSSTASLSTTPSVHSAAGRGRGRRREEVHLSSREKVLSPQRFFTYKPYVPSTGRGWSGERAEKRTGRVKGSRPSNKFYSKERFVLANCRVFIRNETTVSDAGYNPDCSIGKEKYSWRISFFLWFFSHAQELSSISYSFFLLEDASLLIYKSRSFSRPLIHNLLHPHTAIHVSV